MQEETAGIEGHLRVDMETKCSGNFLKYTKVILMRFPNNGDTESQLAISVTKQESSSETGLHSTELLTKKVTWKSPNNQGCC